ncbi:TPM domain-containing protein [Candidatus Saccharibacteria bacterium]|nr:MAG: TPM domain-containing protein [Candidatus Saccharibacteria bacterium]
MKILPRSIIALALMVGAALLIVLPARALEVPSAPTLERPIVDKTSTLSEQQIDQLAQQITHGRGEKSYQVGVLLIPTLGQDEYLEGYSLKVARAWGIGDKTNNGVLLLIVKQDKLVRIEVGTGLEGDLTDSRAKRIITGVIRPYFRSGDYYTGISEGVRSIQLAVAKEADPKLASRSEADGSWWDIVSTFGFFVLFGFMWLASILGRSKSWWAGGVIGGVIGFISLFASQWHPLAVIATIILVPFGLLFDFAVSRNYQQHKSAGTLPSWWAGGGSIGHGSGGGWSGGGFGGGGFSGGGSSGSW